MNKITTLLFVFAAFGVTAQNNALVMKDGAYMVLDGGTSGTPVYVVVDQDHSDGIETQGANGGNIISEGEYNYIKWNISDIAVASTGSYVVPFATGDVSLGSETKIPFTLTKTSAGSSGGSVLFSTYETTGSGGALTGDRNYPRPDGVQHMADAATGLLDNADHVVDRFWMVDASSYGTKPDVTLDFGYNVDASETGSQDPAPNNNNITTGANMLGAQRYNTTDDKWYGWFIGTSPQSIWGTDDGTANVTGVSVPSGNFDRIWTLAELSSPLPYELATFNGNCRTNEVELFWETTSEINNQHFLVERSLDGTTFSILGLVDGSGTSSANVQYSYIDEAPLNELSFYRLTQVDYDGTENESPIIAVSPCESGADVNVFSVDNENNIHVVIETEVDEQYEFYLIDMSGRMVISQTELNAESGQNKFMINRDKLAFGVYNAIVKGENSAYTTKLVLK